jgi:hypothetical protein
VAYDAKVIEIIIASPSDVSEERRIVREVIAEWNALNASERSLVLLPIGWETHSSPELAGRPQQIINDRLLKRADLLVGIFWTRIGSPTGKAISGSIEEIQEHHKERKPIMLYFSNAPVRPDSVDSVQYEQLKNFKEWARREGLIEFFDSSADFRLKFSRQLPLTLRDNPYLKAVSEQRLREGAEIEPTVAFSPPRAKGAVLSAEARQLLATAAADQQGTIVFLRTLSGALIQAGETPFGDPQNQRSVAKWEAAITELTEHGLIRDSDGTGKVFRVTDAGYRAVE